MAYHDTPRNGFTLIEALVVITIIVILFAMSAVNLSRPQETANITTTLDTVLADIKNQQILAMSGDEGGTTSAQPQGLLFQSNNFILFAGSSFVPADPNNFTESLGTGITLSTTLPVNTLIFVKGTGEVQGFTSGSNTITLAGAHSSHTITVSRFGATTIN